MPHIDSANNHMQFEQVDILFTRAVSASAFQLAIANAFALNLDAVLVIEDIGDLTQRHVISAVVTKISGDFLQSASIYGVSAKDIEEHFEYLLAQLRTSMFVVSSEGAYLDGIYYELGNAPLHCYLKEVGGSDGVGYVMVV